MKKAWQVYVESVSKAKEKYDESIQSDYTACRLEIEGAKLVLIKALEKKRGKGVEGPCPYMSSTICHSKQCPCQMYLGWSKRIYDND